MKIGIFGGSFNPIHAGHLILAESARDQLGLDRVLFIPAHMPPHKPSADLLPALTRLEMVKLAIREHPGFIASDIELHRAGPSYTVETVRALHAQAPQAELFLIVGADMLGVEWKGWAELKKRCTIVAAKRPGSKPPAKADKKISWITMPQIGISSSDIRARIRADRSIRYLLPGAVERFIRSRHLYRSRRG
jgi:nicotinate-nucleotide adenylyltransferase